MKKRNILYAILILGIFSFSFSSCVEEDNPTQKIKELRFNITVNNLSSVNTKAVKSDWENGDKIFVYFSECLYKEDFITFTYDASNGTWVGVSSSDLYEWGEDNLGTDGTMFAMCYPFGDVIVDEKNDYEFTFIYNSTNPALHGMPVLSYSLTNGTGDPYHIDIEGDIATLSGTLNMSIPENYVQFYIEKSDGGLYNQNDKYRLSVEGVKPVSVTFDFDDEEFQNVELGSGQPMWGYKYGDGIVFSGMIDDTWSNPQKSHRMVFFSDGAPAVTRTFTNKTLSSHDAIKLKAPIADYGWSRYMDAPEWTEINGIKWSKWYLGSTSLLDVNHDNINFGWGEIIPNGYDGYHPLNSYIIQLTGDYSIYDPARAILGEDWRMPGNDDFSSLLSGSTLSVAEEEGKTIVKFKESDEKYIIFLSKYALYEVGGTLEFWTNESSHYIKAWAWKLNEAAGGSFVKEENHDKKDCNIIRPIYIGE